MSNKLTIILHSIRQKNNRPIGSEFIRKAKQELANIEAVLRQLWKIPEAMKITSMGDITYYVQREYLDTIYAAKNEKMGIE